MGLASQGQQPPKSTAAAVAAHEEEVRINTRRAAMSGWIGSALEYYDFALYAQAAALIFPTIFFPEGNATVALISSLATYAVGYIARPVGAIVLGNLGDRHGRKRVLVWAMLLMGFATMAVGFLPTYQQVGILAPVLLVILRLIQGFAVAGELGGASAMIVEHAPDEKRGFFASFSLQGTQFGSILATGVMLPLAALMPEDAFNSYGWRIPFLLSAVVILAGILIRRHVQEPPVFLAKKDQLEAERQAPVVELLTKHLGLVVRCVLMCFTNAIGMTTLTFGVSYGKNAGYGIEFSTSDMLWVTLIANVVAIVTIPIAGALSDRFGRKLFMIGGGLLGGATSVFYLEAVKSGNLALVILAVIVVQGIFYQMWNATFATFFQEQFPMRIRVTGFALSQNIGLALAAFFPSLFTALAPPGTENVPLIIGGTTFVICAVAAIAAAMTPESRGRSLIEDDDV
ncbi:MFS transporter [Actinomyces sp. MRS3W]|uniref:MFS transporter n=1 Tax=Actinomyces sp. MRS3W TaxID=2800796 RepID=UPI0028FD78E5|nr:MFS transporter [Actinomyces sp. MRS3W]MDU0347647.1 MFS transporter [Actinomyces sp. MRS3W]